MLRHDFQTILGDIPGDWEHRSVKSLLSSHLSGDWGVDNGEAHVAVLRSTNFTDSGNLDLRDVARRGFLTVAASAIQVAKDDILLERSGGGPDRPVGRVVFIPTEMPATGFANFVQLLRPNKEVVVPRFLLWVLFQLHRCGQVARVQHQTTQMRNLDLRDYLRLRIPYPGKAEQLLIADAITEADRHIVAIEERLVAAQRLATALDQAHFAPGPHAVRFPYEYGTDRTIRGGWSAAPLKSIAEVSSGITLNQDREAANNGVRYLTVVNVYRGRIDLAEERYLELRGNEAETKVLSRNDVLVVEGHANAAEIGRAAIVSDREAGMSFQNHLFRVRLFNEYEVRARFLVRALNSQRVRRHWVATAKTSSGLSTINRTGLRRLVIPYPAPTEQDRIVDELEAAEAQVAAIDAQILAARRVKQSLLQNLLTGKVRLKP